MLIVTCIKNSLNNFICHLPWLEKLVPTHTHPLKTICEFSKPDKCDLHKNSLNNFICHLSWIKKVYPTHTNPLKIIHEFLKPYEWGGVGHTWVGWGGVSHTGVG